jgi:hypothetical protein
VTGALLGAALLGAVVVAAAPAGAAAPAAGGGAGALGPDDLEAARIAWRYFERNYQPATGLVSSVEKYPSTTAWDTGSSLIATVAARELGLLDDGAFRQRIAALLRTLERQPLFEGALPNKAYDAANGRMTDYANAPAPRGIGWSAVDLGRATSALRILARFHPEHRAAVARVLRRWKACELQSGGELRGAHVAGAGEVAYVQEGRLGYEQYAAHGLAPLGLDLSKARSWDRSTAEEVIYGVRVRRDARDARRFDAVDALATDPWVLDAMEFGLDPQGAPLLQAVFEVQKRRWHATGVVTAASEDHVDRAPWFVYGSIWADGRPWHAVTPAGEDASALRALSTKAAFALAALHPDDPYSRILRDAIAGARDPERGWFAGIYERGGPNRSLNANTNGVILETLLWKARGALLGGAGEAGLDLPQARCASRRAPVGDTALSGPSPTPLARPPSGPRSLMRLDGSFFVGYRGTDRETAGGVATLWPWRATFLRIGGEYTPFSPFGDSRLLWGVGYDDWRDNTFFVHVDNWGPIRPSDALATRQAEFTAGYKLPRVCGARWLCLSPITSVVAPFAGGPYVHGRVQLSLGRTWFAMGGLGYTLPGVLEGPVGTPRWRVVYGFGRADWSPGGLFVTYHDWGPDSRSGNGILAMGVNWAW